MVMIRSWPPICSRKLEKSGIGTWPHWRTIKPTIVIQANIWIPATSWNVIFSGHCRIKIVFQHYSWSGLIFCYAVIPIKCGLWNPDMDFLVWLHPIIAQCLFWLHLMGERICQRGRSCVVADKSEFWEIPTRNDPMSICRARALEYLRRNFCQEGFDNNNVAGDRARWN